MPPLLAICPAPGTYSERWIASCDERRIPYKLVNCYDSDIIAQLRGVRGLLWNWLHDSVEDQLIARQLLTAVEQMGVKTFPSAKTSWYFDDKVAEKYLLEAIDAPMAPSHVFVERDAALRWIETAAFPKVFKLRSGAGAANVSLVRDRSEAARLVRLMFSKGRVAMSSGYFSDFRRKVRHTRDFRHFVEKLKRMPKAWQQIRHVRRLETPHRGYVYFQDFLPNNAFDTRIVTVCGHAIAVVRDNRPGDFRASGSGVFSFDRTRVDLRCVEIAFDVTRKLGAESLAFDFLFDPQGTPVITEISYTICTVPIQNIAGYWDEVLNWHEGHIWLQDIILQHMLDEITAAGEPSP